ncbi:sulfatase-like hydrolase/transferase [Pareuzebyella sediminis]|uniref:sulfatase-like hydrolase/transferase n=1 Tax=Pareuzebyella sediminis TaxID=2607998 RepID=UPI0011EF673B|nr:sulfatase-like hydrolase/transferase [Pareuzebyella sediminis]
MTNKKSTIVLFSILLGLVIFSCSNEAFDVIKDTDEIADTANTNEETIDTPNSTSSSPNILFIIADDLGKDAINGFTEGSIKPNTPNIDAIRTDGISFQNFWTNPTCTPTRASILTGKYGYRTNVKGAGDILAQSEISLQQYISENTNDAYSSAVVGKWHLAGNDSNVNPEDFGIDYYAGLIRGAVDDYYRWQLTEDGTSSLQTEYTTEVFTDLAINWVNEQSKPWFLWLAYNAPHAPFHIPPSNMHSQGNLPEYSDNLDPLPYYMAAIEAMDFQIGRFLDAIPLEEKENLVIIFIGDNGTPNQVAQSPYSSNKVKNTLYQGGVNVPMFVSGSSVSRIGTDHNLITSTDLFATIAEITGIPTREIHDSKSFKGLLTIDTPTREFQYSEMNNGLTDEWTASNGVYKFIIDSSGDEQLYNLMGDSYEENNLLNGTLSSTEQDAKTLLEAELSAIRD